MGLIAVVLVAAAVVTVAAVSRGDGKPAKPAQLSPSKQFGDDANLMRRLQRERLVKKAK